MTTQLTDTQAELKGHIIWTCPVRGCREGLELTKEDADLIGFFVVHHLVQKHGFTRSEVLAYDLELRDAANEYIGFPRQSDGKLMA